MKNLLAKIEFLKNLDNKKIFLLVLVCLIIAYMDFSIILKIQLNGIKANKSKIVKLKKDLDTVTSELNKLNNPMNNNAMAKGTFIQNKRIVSQADVPSLLQDISNMAKKNDVTILQIAPSKQAEAREKEKISETEGLSSLSLSLTLLGDYHHLGKFINDLENSHILIVVQSLNIRPQAQETDFLKQGATLVLKTYVRK